ncbi:hypothetical protein NU219Hw_g8543t1 [Hortaea werneckii]
MSTDPTFHNFTAQQAAADASEQMIRRAKQEAPSPATSPTGPLSSPSKPNTAATSPCCSVRPVSNQILSTSSPWPWPPTAPQFPTLYLSAAQSLSSGGTFAIWTTSSYSCHPSVPEHRDIQTCTSLPPKTRCWGLYKTPGNRLARGCDDHLLLPWTPLSAVADADADGSLNPSAGLFDEATFERKCWDRDGVSSASPLPNGSPAPFLLGREVDLQGGLQGLDSSGPVVRWWEANPEKANPDLDPIRIIAARLRQVVGEQTKLVVAPAFELGVVEESWNLISRAVLVESMPAMMKVLGFCSS